MVSVVFCGSAIFSVQWVCTAHPARVWSNERSEDSSSNLSFWFQIRVVRGDNTLPLTLCSFQHQSTQLCFWLWLLNSALALLSLTLLITGFPWLEKLDLVATVRWIGSLICSLVSYWKTQDGTTCGIRNEAGEYWNIQGESWFWFKNSGWNIWGSKKSAIDLILDQKKGCHHHLWSGKFRESFWNVADFCFCLSMRERMWKFMSSLQTGGNENIHSSLPLKQLTPLLCFRQPKPPW